MMKQKKLTQDQLNEIKELAKTKTLTEIGRYFNMNEAAFLLLRKQQPEINTIYHGTPKEKKCKLYTPEEILEIGEMAETANLETIASNLGISIPRLNRARANQPELDKVLINSIKNRASNFNYKTPTKAKPKRPEYRMPDEASPEEAIVRFRKLKEEEKRKRLIQELKEIDL